MELALSSLVLVILFVVAVACVHTDDEESILVLFGMLCGVLGTLSTLILIGALQ